MHDYLGIYTLGSLYNLSNKEEETTETDLSPTWLVL